MTERSVTHATFVIERTYDASPARVFAAWATPAAKARWFAGPDDWEKSDHELDFRVGGRERVSGGPPGGPIHVYDARLPGHRAGPAHRLQLRHAPRRNAHLRLAGDGGVQARGRRHAADLTEQGAFLDGYDDPAQREQGTRELLDNLGSALKRESARA